MGGRGQWWGSGAGRGRGLYEWACRGAPAPSHLHTSQIAHRHPMCRKEPGSLCMHPVRTHHHPTPACTHVCLSSRHRRAQLSLLHCPLCHEAARPHCLPASAAALTARPPLPAAPVIIARPFASRDLGRRQLPDGSGPSGSVNTAAGRPATPGAGTSSGSGGSGRGAGHTHTHRLAEGRLEGADDVGGPPGHLMVVSEPRRLPLKVGVGGVGGVAFG